MVNRAGGGGMMVALRLAGGAHMIRTSLPKRKQVITKLVLRRETVRTLGASELAVVVGGHGPNCTAETYMASGCVPTA